jgi:cell fate (sporulation/competence/biofilm development) regulator YlbF (YheA/YmcA/DUF963 family)
MANTDLKVSDLILFSEDDFKELKLHIDGMSKLIESYGDTNTQDLEGLEDIKKSMIGKMQRFTELYAKVRAYKGSSHEYLDEQRKRFKSQAIKRMMDEPDMKKSITKAKELVYDYPFYVERYELTESIRKFFIKVDELHSYYNDVLRAITQTISVGAKEKGYTNHS